MCSQTVSTILQSNYLFLSRFPHAGFRNEIGGRKIAHKRKRGDTKTIKTTEESRKMANGKLFCSVNSCGQRKKNTLCSRMRRKCQIFKRLNKFLHGRTSQSFQHSNVDWKCHRQDSVSAISQIFLNTEPCSAYCIQ